MTKRGSKIVSFRFVHSDYVSDNNENKNGGGNDDNDCAHTNTQINDAMEMDWVLETRVAEHTQTIKQIERRKTSPVWYMNTAEAYE